MNYFTQSVIRSLAIRYDAPGEGERAGRVSHTLESSTRWEGLMRGGGGHSPTSGSDGGCADPYRKRLLSLAADRDVEAVAEVEGRSSGQLAALAVSDAATSAVTSRRCAAGDAASCPPSEPASPASDGARTSACCDPADSDASPGDNSRY